jgi:hypothetical protein
VRLESGEEGWVQHQFLTSQPIARDRLDAAQAERDRARAELDRVARERNDLDARVRAGSRRISTPNGSSARPRSRVPRRRRPA